jgi:putative ABC transport system substrate-binding protein
LSTWKATVGPVPFPKRRAFIKAFAAAGTVRLLGCTQARQQVPTIGFLSSVAADTQSRFVSAFRSGLNEEGYVEGQNIAIEYRFADGHYERLPALAADLVSRQVALIAATGGIVSARAAQVATSTIPILFISGFDPVRLGFISSFNRPGGNMTGVSVYTTELTVKRLDLLHQIVPNMTTIAFLVNPNDILVGGIEKDELETAAKAAGLRMVVVEARGENELEAALVAAAQQQANAILVSADPFFQQKRAQLVALAERLALPAGYAGRDFVELGGLMSYAPDFRDMYRQIGRYAGRILKGATPNELPVQLPRRFHLAINTKTAQALGLAVPRILLAGVDELFD